MAKRGAKPRTAAAAAGKTAAVKKSAKPAARKKVEAISHAATAARRNIPTAEYQDAAESQEAMDPRGPVTFKRARPLAQHEARPRDADKDPQIVWKGVKLTLTPAQIRALIEKEKEGKPATIEIGDAQLVWRGKDEQDWSDLVVNAPLLYTQEKIHPKAIIDDLVRHSADKREAETDAPSLFGDLFADFNGLKDPEARTEFYQHSQHWSNRMILGDSLQVMASLAEREALRGQVQCIYFDPPYGISFHSNWQIASDKRDANKEGDKRFSQEPEVVRAFRDTWSDGIHSYLTFIRDRITVLRDLLNDSGSLFVQINDANAALVRCAVEEVFRSENFVTEIFFQKTGNQPSGLLESNADRLIWVARDKRKIKFRPLYVERALGGKGGAGYIYVRLPTGVDRPLSKEERKNLSLLPAGSRLWAADPLTSDGFRDTTTVEFVHNGRHSHPGPNRHWGVTTEELGRVAKADRIDFDKSPFKRKTFFDEYPIIPLGTYWDQLGGATDKVYVVQTNPLVIERCILMCTDPGDLVLDPTCGSGTTAYVAEQWGRRWITIDTSRVALALARTRLMSARFPFYHLADSAEGRSKEQEVSGKLLPDEVLAHKPTGDIRHGFVYERAPHITLKSIANNEQIDTIWETAQTTLEPLRAQINAALKKSWQEWEIPRDAEASWPDAGKKAHAVWWECRIRRQRDIDDSIKKNADIEYLYDRPYPDTSKIRVTGPFTVESLSPHRVVPSGSDDMADELKAMAGKRRRTRLATPPADFTAMIIEHLRTAGVHQVEKSGTLKFDSIAGRATKRGEYIGAEATYLEGDQQRRAAILIGPEYGALTKADLLAAAQEAQRDRFDVLVACAFAFDAHASELLRLGPLAILKAKMNPDLHMAGELKNTGKGNLFVVFGEPDIDILEQDGDRIAIRINGIDVFDPNTGDIRSGDTKSIAAWFIDSDYNEESFFVRHAYFLGANDPYKSLKSALKAEIDAEAWATLYRDTSRPFTRPRSGKIAVKVINHFGDEVMKVFRV